MLYESTPCCIVLDKILPFCVISPCAAIYSIALYCVAVCYSMFHCTSDIISYCIISPTSPHTVYSTCHTKDVVSYHTLTYYCVPY